MIRSMTGYGAAAIDTPALQASVTIKSLNHRYFDLSLHLSRCVAALEPEVKELVQSRLGRGKVDLSLHVTLTQDETPARVVARPYVPQLVSTLRALRQEHGLAGDISLSDLARFGVIEVVEATSEFSDERRQQVFGVLRQAIDELEKMRAHEGENLSKDLHDRLAAIEAGVARIEGQMDVSRTARIGSLQERVRAMTQELGFDEARLYQEVVKLVDRQDTSEEISRLRSHVSQARSLLARHEAVGKRLDFLAQEFAREANTIGSKSASAPVTQEVVGLKAEIEKLREQVQNVE